MGHSQAKTKKVFDDSMGMNTTININFYGLIKILIMMKINLILIE